jgi:hypothetical protein
MTPVLCPIASAFALCVAAASLAAAPVVSFAAPADRDGPAPADAVVSAARPEPISAPLPPTPLAARPLRTLDVDDTAIGVESDPERFDSSGLEIWWQRYEQRRRGPR